MSTTRSELDLLIDEAALNPMAVQKAGISYLEKVRKGEVEIVDASNAFVYMGEFAATLFANALRKNEVLGHKQYPELALTREELYNHMSNVDYIGVFGNPSVATLSFCFNREELIEKAVATGNAGMRKLVIGRHTQIKAGDYVFTLQYPIEIRVLSHGGIHVVYDNDRISPLQSLETNSIDWTIENYTTNRQEYIKINVPVYQMELKSYTTALTAAKVFNKSYAFADQFHYCRVYMSTASGAWQEINTTHSDQVFDPLVPTALLKVLDGNLLNVTIPQIYYSSGLVTRELRIDVYSTKGAVEVALNQYGSEMFVPTWRDLDKDDKGLYTAPVATLINMFIVAISPATGGTNETTLEELKQRVVNNALGAIDLPITNIQIQSQLDRLTDVGFSCVMEIDNVTKRLYKATRELPAPAIAEISTGVGSNVVTLMKTINELVTQADVADNGERVTILPSTLYKNEGGYLSIVDAAQRDAIFQLGGDSLVEAVTSGNYLYTPFHYVYDFTDNVFTVRPYYFGSPEISRRYFVEDNSTLGVGVSSSSHNLVRTDTGWALQVMTNSTDSLKALDDDSLVAQLAFVPVGETSRCYMNGTRIGRDAVTKEWIFEFRFDSTWDVDPSDSIYLDGFEVDGISPHPYPAKLSTVFDIFYAVETAVVDRGENTVIDQRLGQFLISLPVTGIYQEQVTLTLGSELSGLWVRARSTIGTESYVHYAEDVPKIHTTNIPARDENGTIVMIRDGDGRVTGIVYENRVGDPVIENDRVVLLHRRGDIILQDGIPIVESPRSIERQVELCLFDGVYYFATGQSDVEYKATVPDQIVTWVNQTLAPVRNKLLELTTLLFHPKATIGLVNAIVDGAQVRSMEAAQAFDITFYVTEKVNRDDDLKVEMRKTTRAAITAMLKDTLITRDGIETELRSIMGADVIGVDVEGLGGAANHRVVSMADDSSRLCIGKKLVSLPNGTFTVEDNINIVFKQHTV